jgi:hypothetical protein
MNSTHATLMIHNQDDQGQAISPRHKSKSTGLTTEPDDHAPPGSFRGVEAPNFRQSRKGLKSTSKRKIKGQKDPSAEGIELMDPVSYISQTSSSNVAHDDIEHDSRSSTYSQRIDYARQTDRPSHSPIQTETENSSKENSRKSHKRVSSRKRSNDDGHANSHPIPSTKGDHTTASTKSMIEKPPELEDM